jgi:hypothetical protein
MVVLIVTVVAILLLLPLILLYNYTMRQHHTTIPGILLGSSIGEQARGGWRDGAELRFVKYNIYSPFRSLAEENPPYGEAEQYCHYYSDYVRF